MANEHYLKVLKDLGETIGIDGLAPDGDSYCCVGFDEKIVIHFQYNEENDILMLFAQLGILKEAYGKEIYPKLLKANLFWQGTGGGTIGVDDASGEVLMSYQLHVQTVDSQSFQDIIEGFVNTAELWISTLEQVQTKEPGGLGGAPDLPGSPGGIMV